MEEMAFLISLNYQVYQASESVTMTQRVHNFLDLGLSYFYRIKVMSWIKGEYLQWTKYVEAKNHGCMYIKKLAKNFPGLLISH